MPYLIDGHNLIPHAGLRLDAVEDELELIQLLQEHSRRTRKTIVVYFDGAPVGRAGTRKFGLVTAHFVSQQSSADAAIRDRLTELKGAARNWTVVSSDGEVLASAQAAHASIETSAEFARRLIRVTHTADQGSSADPRDGGASEDEVRHWLNVFKRP